MWTDFGHWRTVYPRYNESQAAWRTRTAWTRSMLFFSFITATVYTSVCKDRRWTHIGTLQSSGSEFCLPSKLRYVSRSDHPDNTNVVTELFILLETERSNMVRLRMHLRDKFRIRVPAVITTYDYIYDTKFDLKMGAYYRDNIEQFERTIQTGASIQFDDSALLSKQKAEKQLHSKKEKIVKELKRSLEGDDDDETTTKDDDDDTTRRNLLKFQNRHQRSLRPICWSRDRKALMIHLLIRSSHEKRFRT